METRRDNPHALRAFGIAAIAVFVLASAPRIRAQVFEVVGGNSSLYQAGGGSLLVHGPGYDSSIGAGVIGGHFTYGGKVERQIGNYVMTAGDDELDMLFPTDVFDASHYLYARGAGLKGKMGGLDVNAFGGTTSSLYFTPIFQGGDSGDGMGFLSIHRTLSPQWQLWSTTLYSGKMTQLVAAQWTPRPRFHLAATAGIGANAPYGAASVSISRKRFDLLGSYISAGTDFRRVVVSTPIQAEPDKANLLVTLRPTRYLTLAGGTQSYEVPDPTTHSNVGSSVRTASGTLQAGGAIVNATAYDSTAFGENTRAAAVTATRDINRWVKVMSSYMVSKPQNDRGTSSIFSTITENLNQHISVNENISTSNGQTSVHYGGSLLTNLVTFSASYETFYVPVHTTSPFQQSLMLDAGVHLFGRVNLHGASFVGPTGQTLYTATVSALGVRGQAEGAPGIAAQMPMGDNILRIQVLDDSGQPVEGAALLIDAKPVFTGADGVFEMHERKSHVHSLKVLTDQFLDAGEWEIKSMPSAVSSQHEGGPGAVVVVHRVPLARAPADQQDAGSQEVAHEHK